MLLWFIDSTKFTKISSLNILDSLFYIVSVTTIHLWVRLRVVYVSLTFNERELLFDLSLYFNAVSTNERNRHVFEKRKNRKSFLILFLFADEMIVSGRKTHMLTLNEKRYFRFIIFVNRTQKFHNCWRTFMFFFYLRN